jgi:hypothetical protein
MMDRIACAATESNKHILIMGSARSGTHALGAVLSARLPTHTNLKEVCGVDHRQRPWDDILQFYNNQRLLIGHVVGFTSKIKLSADVARIKEHCVVVNIKRNNKVDQFSSWMYFHKTHAPFELWHNHTPDQMLLEPGSIEATMFDIEQFIIEQLVDDFFLPDFVVDYERADLNTPSYKKNQFGFDIKQIFSNLEFVETELKNWHHAPEHYRNLL